jgi:hypothetical protein
VQTVETKVDSILEELKKLVIPSKKEEAAPETKPDEVVPETPEIKLDDPVKFMHVRLRGGRIVKRKVEPTGKQP